MAPLKNPIEMAVIGAAHGIKGEVRVRPFTGDPMALNSYGPLFAQDGRAFEIATLRAAGEMLVVRFKSVLDRNAAEALNGTALFVDRTALPDDGEDGEFYHADLVGLSVRDDLDAVIGKVIAVQNFGGGDLLEVEHQGRRGVMIPFTQAAVPVVDVKGGFVTIDPIAAGLADAEDEDAADADGRP